MNFLDWHWLHGRPVVWSKNNPCENTNGRPSGRRDGETDGQLEAREGKNYKPGWQLGGGEAGLAPASERGEIALNNTLSEEAFMPTDRSATHPFNFLASTRKGIGSKQAKSLAVTGIGGRHR